MENETEKYFITEITLLLLVLLFLPSVSSVMMMMMVIMMLMYLLLQLILTFMLTSIIVYLYTVLAFNFFRKFYVQEEEGEEPESKCHDMLSVRLDSISSFS